MQILKTVPTIPCSNRSVQTVQRSVLRSNCSVQTIQRSVLRPNHSVQTVQCSVHRSNRSVLTVQRSTGLVVHFRVCTNDKHDEAKMRKIQDENFITSCLNLYTSSIKD
jgi:hypothetical protein